MNQKKTIKRQRRRIVQIQWTHILSWYEPYVTLSGILCEENQAAQKH